jgi:hypothetical protein
VKHNYCVKKEFVFQIEQDDDMLVAACHEAEMATQGENLDELLAMIRDLIRCRFDRLAIYGSHAKLAVSQVSVLTF